MMGNITAGWINLGSEFQGVWGTARANHKRYSDVGDKEQIADELRSECNYDIREGLYINDNGDLIHGGGQSNDHGYADYLADERRKGGAA